jgi:hypothetical protein
MYFIREYNYSNIITEKQQDDIIKLVNYLFKSGNWDKNKPKFQTYENLFLYEELKTLKETFLNSCCDYLEIKKIHEYKMNMWCYKDNIVNTFWRNEKKSWHCHANYDEIDRISGIYYLRNPKNEGTEFENFKINPESYTWYLFPSYLLHKPPKTKSLESRYTIAADLWKMR